MRVGIIGAGKLGTALGRRALKAGHEVVIAGRPGAEQTALVAEIMVPGAKAVPLTVWGICDVAILAVPFSIALSIDLPLTAGTVVIDPTNHWASVDGPLPDLDGRSTSEVLAARHPELRWVKSLNQLGYHDWEDEALGATRRPAMGIASDSPTAVAVAQDLVASLGLEPVTIGPLAAGALLQPDRPPFGTPLTDLELRVLAEAVTLDGSAS